MADNGSTSKTMQFMVNETVQGFRAPTGQARQEPSGPESGRREVQEAPAETRSRIPASDSGYLPSVKEDRIAMAIAIMESLRRALKGNTSRTPTSTGCSRS